MGLESQNAGKPFFLRWFAAPHPAGPPGHLIPRWIFLRALGLIYFSAFFSLVFQIRGLMAPDGLLPANLYLEEVAKMLGHLRFWYAPTLLWINSSGQGLTALCWVGMIASILLTLNLWPRGMLAICFVLFLSFVTAAQDFSGYQSDGMLLAAGFISFFFAPRGWRPGRGAAEPPSRASLFLLQWLWFRIYFESGIAKYFGGDPSWRNLTAMDQYYQNGPLPTWIGWYVQQLPHWFHASSAFYTLLVELLIVWMLFLPPRFRIICFFIVTPMQISIILTANYAFLNHLVLFLGVLLLDDRFALKFLPEKWAWVLPVRKNLEGKPEDRKEELVELDLTGSEIEPRASAEEQFSNRAGDSFLTLWVERTRRFSSAVWIWLTGILLAWVLYATSFLLLAQVFRGVPLPAEPVGALDPFRIANQYGLFGRMTWRRYEIEFQGSNDGVNWTAYPFRFKPQDPAKAPGIYAPYQPRFEWNLWFASLGYWRENPFVIHTEELLLENDRDVLALFAGNPFPHAPPKQIRAVLWQYWFTDLKTKRETGMWWRREDKGLYAPALERGPDGKVFVTAWPEELPPPP